MKKTYKIAIIFLLAAFSIVLFLRLAKDKSLRKSMSSTSIEVATMTPKTISNQTSTQIATNTTEVISDYDMQISKATITDSDVLDPKSKWLGEWSEDIYVSQNSLPITKATEDRFYFDILNVYRGNIAEVDSVAVVDGKNPDKAVSIMFNPEDGSFCKLYFTHKKQLILVEEEGMGVDCTKVSIVLFRESFFKILSKSSLL